MTRERKHWVYKAVSYLWDFPVEKATSEISGQLQVRMVNGTRVLDSRNANYSYGSLHRLFRKAFHHLDFSELSPSSGILLLGLGAGSVDSILRNEYGIQVPITAVDIDPVIIRLATQYFGIRQYDDLHIICQDASVYLKEENGSFGLIIVDLFVDNDVPEPFITPGFLSGCRDKMTKDGIMLFNFIVHTKKQQEHYQSLCDNLHALGMTYTINKYFSTNRVLTVRRS